MNQLRGHDIEFKGGEWVYCDNGESTIKTHKDRPCGYCGKHNTPEGHDACLGMLPNVINACCGHGVESESYVQYKDGTIIRGKELGIVNIKD